uniref:Uncharacterized protein n=1 Tax=Takifugu rubripes TaxID=31033 RepID=A0A674PKV7_TAKRU
TPPPASFPLTPLPASFPLTPLPASFPLTSPPASFPLTPPPASFPLTPPPASFPLTPLLQRVQAPNQAATQSLDTRQGGQLSCPLWNKTSQPFRPIWTWTLLIIPACNL